ncbi:hypothetical protein MTR_8g028685 [Medicago truncatula]|uniref:Uncharacterized protein n=1 Tax=Medicago truncatula TaxID=3880 RepID=A0A072TZ51_MEDTR|nr:hypothetical protein MTR_8g028685 [Medicago truncatula]
MQQFPLMEDVEVKRLFDGRSGARGSLKFQALEAPTSREKSHIEYTTRIRLVHKATYEFDEHSLIFWKNHCTTCRRIFGFFRGLLIEMKGSSVGVLVSGSKQMRHEVAFICSSGLVENMHFESISFTW